MSDIRVFMEINSELYEFMHDGKGYIGTCAFQGECKNCEGDDGPGMKRICKRCLSALDPDRTNGYYWRRIGCL